MTKPKKSQPWQGTIIEYQKLSIPLHFYMLCKLMNTEPTQVLYDFMVAAGAEANDLGQNLQKKAVHYFIQCGYGKKQYSSRNIRQMLQELRTIHTLVSKGPKRSKHAEWHELYYEHWYKKWSAKMQKKK